MDLGVLERRRPTSAAKVDLGITGMSCAGCVRRVERTIAAVPGVAEVSVNLATERARVTPAAGFDLARVAEALQTAGYPLAPESLRSAANEQSAKQQAARLDAAMAALALALAAPLFLPMLLMPFGLDLALPDWAQFGLAAIVQVVFGGRFYRGAWKALRGGTGTMDTLVALGTSAAFGLSLWQWASGGGQLYFEASATVIALVRLGKWLEARARRQAGAAIRALERLQPERARVRRGGAEQEVAVAALQAGDLLVIKPGERVAADCVVREGISSADESLLTGESLPVPKQPGDALVGGALNGEALLLAEVTAVGAETRLARIVRLVEDAQSGKPPVQRLVDRVSAIFVPVVIALALLTGLGWMLAGAGFAAAAVNAVAVLVIACPCALGLATPAAIAVGTGVAARYGILIRDPAALEQAGAIRTVVFDKTGTLTAGRPQLVALQPAPGQNAETVLALAAALQAGSEHLLARAVLTASGPVTPAANIRTLAGRGVAGEVAGHLVRLGNAALMHESGVALEGLLPAAEKLEHAGRTVSFLAEGSRLLGLLAFGDAIKPGAAAAIARLRARGLHVVLLTGDSQGAADVAAHALGIADVRAGALPADKVAAIADLHAQGRVAMVGDGVNDAAALAAADLGLAMATGTDVAGAAAGITLMRGDPAMVPAALDIAARTHRRIRQGLFWAFAYNLVGIPLAACGWLSPVAAGAAMAFSSASVVGSALLLRRWRPELPGTPPAARDAASNPLLSEELNRR